MMNHPDIERYVTALLSFTPAKNRVGRLGDDYISLIHVPVEGAEIVYTLNFGEDNALLTTTRFRETVWELVERGAFGEGQRPPVDVTQATVDYTHPIFEYFEAELLNRCDNHSDGQPGMEYFLLLWQREGMGGASECWEPTMRKDRAWHHVTGAMQTLYSQFEFAAVAASA